MERNSVRLVKLALEADVRISFRQLVFRGDQVGVKAISTECSLKLIVSRIGSGFSINFEGLVWKISRSYVRWHY